ncbi:hypothetical protein ACFYTF_14885 [Nocardia thailandica]|uniref:Uncharacterized protein n=1 Tax=Nocardia thailandica TaxID=257275 RepID=A0ABW6PP03_9NOCA
MRTSVAEIEAAARAVPDIEDAAVAQPRGRREAVLFAVTEPSPRKGFVGGAIGASRPRCRVGVRS